MKNWFKSKVVSWKDVAVLKTSVLLVGVAIGAFFPEVFAPYAGILLALGIALGVYVAFVWLRP